LLPKTPKPHKNYKCKSLVLK